MSYGDTTYTPPSNITVIAECWGSGGQGRLGTFFDSNNRFMGPGGGGGAYARKAGLVLTGGTPYSVRVGAPGQIAAPHESFFITDLTCKASFGTNATNDTTPGMGNGKGGTAAASVGDVKFSGGDGQAYLGPDNTARPGGGGGSSATRVSDGAPGVGQTGGLILGGGNGGDGGHAGPGGAGVGGRAPGGGGGGGGTPASALDPGSTAGPGSEGAVVIWEDVGVWPPPDSGPGSVPLYQAGTPPPPANHPKFAPKVFYVK